ncbi:hypothetical protein VNO77_08551 [Canavalia gladiata]|uniref:Uncharacterized protein n=1 Tax=Canavalia gladiata TaxID=3824 RepID=A0AAN9ME02_CANGL
MFHGIWGSLPTFTDGEEFGFHFGGGKDRHACSEIGLTPIDPSFKENYAFLKILMHVEYQELSKIMMPTYRTDPEGNDTTRGALAGIISIQLKSWNALICSTKVIDTLFSQMAREIISRPNGQSQFGVVHVKRREVEAYACMLGKHSASYTGTVVANEVRQSEEQILGEPPLHEDDCELSTGSWTSSEERISFEARLYNRKDTCMLAYVNPSLNLVPVNSGSRYTEKRTWGPTVCPTRNLLAPLSLS